MAWSDRATASHLSRVTSTVLQEADQPPKAPVLLRFSEMEMDRYGEDSAESTSGTV